MVTRWRGRAATGSPNALSAPSEDCNFVKEPLFEPKFENPCSRWLANGLWLLKTSWLIRSLANVYHTYTLTYAATRYTSLTFYERCITYRSDALRIWRCLNGTTWYSRSGEFTLAASCDRKQSDTKCGAWAEKSTSFSPNRDMLVSFVYSRSEWRS